MDSQSKPSNFHSYAYSHVHPAQPVTHRVSDSRFSVVEGSASQPKFLDTQQQKVAGDPPLALFPMSELNSLCTPCFTARRHDSLEIPIANHEENIETVAFSTNSPNETPPPRSTTEMLQFLRVVEDTARLPLGAIEEPSKSRQPSVLSDAAFLFEIYAMKMHIEQRKKKDKIGDSLPMGRVPQKVTKAVKRQTQFLPGNSVERSNSRNRFVSQSLRSQGSTYQQAFRALPLVIKCLPEPLRERLIAKAKAKAFKIATTLLEGWCL